MRKPPFDYWILFIYLFLVSLGVLFIYSATYQFSVQKTGNSYFFFQRHMVGVGLGLVLMLFFFYYPIQKLRKKMPWIIFFTLLFLVLSLVPFIGKEAGGANRWVSLGLFSFQPSEVAKIVIVIYLAFILEKKKEYIKDFMKAVLPPFLLCSVIAGFVLLQKDFSTFVFLIFLTFVLLYIAGTKFLHLFLTFLATLPIIFFFIFTSGYRMERIKMLLEYEKNPQASYQLFQSVEAFKQGGVLGEGLGKGAKTTPYIFNDFIYTAIGEEAGLIGALLVLLLFFFLWIQGVKLAKQYPPQSFESILAFGMSFMLVFQALINIAVTLAILFPTGITLPFLSYGRTSFLVSSVAIGILLQLSRRKNNLSEK